MYIKIVFKEVNLENNYIIYHSKYPFVLAKERGYAIGSFRNIWKIKRKKREMEDVAICNKSIIRANSIKYKMDYNLYKINEEEFKKEELRLLNKIKCKNIDDFYTKLKQVLNDIKFLKE